MLAQPVNNRDIADSALMRWRLRRGRCSCAGNCEHAGRELAMRCAAARARAWTLGVPGGAVWEWFKAGDVILDPFEGELTGLAPRARVVHAPYPPVVGAVILALLRAGAACDETTRRRLAESWKEVEKRHE